VLVMRKGELERSENDFKVLNIFVSFSVTFQGNRIRVRVS
jgi:hypothetical protein